MIKAHLYTRVSKEEMHHEAELGTQPLHDVLISELYDRYWHFTWNRGKRLFNAYDRLAQWIHERHCNDDCGVWYRRDGSGAHPGCTWLSPDIERDCKQDHYNRRNFTGVTRVPIPDDAYRTFYPEFPLGNS